MEKGAFFTIEFAFLFSQFENERLAHVSYSSPMLYTLILQGRDQW